MLFELGARLKAIRLDLGLSRGEVAKRAKISKTMIEKYENSFVQPSVEVLIRLCQIYKVSMDYVLGNEKNRCLALFNLSTHSEKKDAVNRLINDISIILKKG